MPSRKLRQLGRLLHAFFLMMVSFLAKGSVIIKITRTMAACRSSLC
jgi:hypothetical protein